MLAASLTVYKQRAASDTGKIDSWTEIV